jgi:hypothetical protein
MCTFIVIYGNNMFVVWLCLFFAKLGRSYFSIGEVI